MDDDELATWTSLHYLLLRLPHALDTHTRSLTGLSHFEFAVLAQLITQPGATARMSRLAADAGASPSRLSNVVRRLEERGLITRVAATDDRRSMIAEVTADGRALFDRVAVDHASEIRRLVLSPLSVDQQHVLRESARRILATIDASVPTEEELAPTNPFPAEPASQASARS